MIFTPFRRLLPALLLLGCTLSLQAAGDYDLTPQQDARLRQYMPRTYAKLAQRAPVHVVTIGDSVMNNFGYAPESNDTLKAYQTVFVKRLADQFFYPGGVRVVKPQSGKSAKENDLQGQEITVQNLARGGKLMLHAMQVLTTGAFENKPDLVLVSFGINESTMGQSLASYRRNVQDVIDAVKAQGADILLFGPSLTVNDPAEHSLGLTRGYSDTMKEVAQANGVFFCDLGDLSALIKIDQRGLAAEKAKKPKPPAPDAKPEPPPAPSPIQNPVADQLDPDPDKRAMRFFDFVVQDYRKHFNHGAIVDWVHPDEAFHRILGRRVFSELLDGPKQTPWQIGAATATMENATKCVLSYKIENETDKEQTVTLLPLVTTAWRPMEAPTEVILKPKGKGTVSVTYTRSIPDENASSARGDALLPPHEPLLRLPILHMAGDVTRIDDVRAYITPLAVTWEVGTQFNVDGKCTLKGSIVNTTDKPITGKWDGVWMDQKWSGSFTAPAKGGTPFTLEFKVPTAAGLLKQKSALGMIVTAGSTALRYDREIEVVRNIGLKEPVVLLQNKDYMRGQTTPAAVPSATSPGISFQADADAKTLYLTWDVYGINLQDNADGSGAFTVEASLDARSYGKRLTHGATDVIRATCGAADGAGTVVNIQPWVFGTGYAMAFDAKAVKTKLTSRPDGSRRFTMSVPRSYLYLHEWAIGNGNSQLGINSTFYLWQKSSADQTGSFVPYWLTSSALNRDDAEAHAVLELSDKPTKRWTVRFY